MSYRHQELTSPEQTATGKDFSNPLIVDSLLKTIEKLSDSEVQEKASTETEPFIQEVTPTEVIQDQGILRKGVFEVSTAGATKERLSIAEAIRLEEQMNEEQRAQIARDEEIARQWDEEERKRAMSEAKSTKKIDLE
ncbi:hypothetical protein Tco_0606828 [Tanacetum coccineum]